MDTNTVENDAVKTNELDAELEELLNAVEPEADAPEEKTIIEEPSEAEVEAAVVEVEATEARAEAHEAQPAEEQKAKIEEPDAKAKKKKTASTRVSLIGMSVSKAIQTVCGSGWRGFMALESTDLDEDGNVRNEVVTSRLKAFDGLAKKQGQKAINTFKWLSNGNKLEGYVAQALALIVDKGEMTSNDLREHYLAHPYSQGTANSQTNQIMSLFPVLGIATRDSKSLTLNPNSTIVEHYKTVTAAAKAA